jgi:hypothetical protein
MTDSIQIPATISKPRKPRALAAVEACEASQVIEGQGAQAMAFRIVEQPSQLLGRSFDSLAVERLCRGGLLGLRHVSPAGVGLSESNVAAHGHDAV